MKKILHNALAAVLALAVPLLTLPAAGCSASANPFAGQDALRRQAIQDSLTRHTGRSSGGSDSSAGAAGNRYIVQYKSGAPLTSIYRSLKGCRYALLADSSQRLFSVTLSDAARYQSRWGSLIANMSANKTLKVQSVAAPNDPDYSQQWSYSDIKLPDAWNITTGSPNVRVAVIDTGFDRQADDFNNTNDAAGNYIANGCDLSYIFAKTKTSSIYKPVTTDGCGHGTAVTSVLASTANNGKGLTGACWNITVVPYKVGDSSGTIYLDAVVKALRMAADSGCAVINMSFGTYDYDASLQAAVNYAASKGCILLAASGNEGADSKLSGQYSYPASYDNVVSVASVGRQNTVSDFSQHNGRVDVSAPGEDILVNWGTNSGGKDSSSIQDEDGTSFATPLVAAVAALVRSKNPSVTQGAFETLLRTTSTDLGAPSRDDSYGWGLVNAQAMLTAASSRYYLKVGRAATLMPALTGTITYASSDATVASVSAAGLVTALKEGTAVITASDGTNTLSYMVTVDSTPPKFGAVTYSTKKLTRGNVKVSVKVSGYSQSSTLTTVFTQNGSFTFTARDEAGNTAVKTVRVKNIDKKAPVVRASVSNNKTTRTSVRLAVSDTHLKSITVTRNGRAVSWNGGLFRLHGKYVVTAWDKAGNKTVFRFSII